MSDLDEYRANARTWIAANLKRWPGGRAPSMLFTGGRETTDEEFAAQRALQRKLYEAGYAGITWPSEYGGQGLTRAHQKAFDEEATGYALPHFGVIGSVTYGVCATTMLAHGSPEFLRLHIPRILAGDELVAQFFSDPEAGSDLAGVRTQAVRDGDRWILNGSKIWSSGAYHANYGLCLARTDWSAPKHRGLTWFAVPTDAPGVTVQRIKQVNGEAEFCQEFFDDVVLTDDDVVGEVNDGWTVTRTMLFFERGGGSSGGTAGGAAPAAGVAPDLVRLAEAAGRIDDPAARDLIAQCHVDDLARKALGARIGALIRADPARGANVASYGKLAAGVFDPIRANRALRIGGTRAVTWENADDPGAGATTALLNSRFMAIAGGTTQMQRNAIGERVLDLPREPSFDSAKPFRDVLRDARNWSGKVG